MVKAVSRDSMYIIKVISALSGNFCLFGNLFVYTVLCLIHCLCSYCAYFVVPALAVLCWIRASIRK